MIFLKLGGSLITDKTRSETPRSDVLRRVAAEVAAFCAQISRPPLLLGHGSGSFGHMAARAHGTRGGVRTAANWRGFAEVSVAAARLNRITADALHAAGVPVFSTPPSASVQCSNGRITGMSIAPIASALRHGIVPLVMGDVAIDDVLGGTIVSTEEVFAHLAAPLSANEVLLAGEMDGVYAGFADSRPIGGLIPHITLQSWAAVQAGVGLSRGADVTGGMAAKVSEMLALIAAHPQMRVRIFSGLQPGNLTRALDGEPVGTLLSAA